MKRTNFETGRPLAAMIFGGAICLVTAGLPGRADAQEISEARPNPEERSVTVLGCTGPDEFSAERAEFYAALRAQVEFHPSFQLNDVPPQELSDVLLAIGCTELSLDCSLMLKEVAGTDLLLWSELETDAAGATLNLVLWDLERAEAVRTRVRSAPSPADLVEHDEIFSRSVLYDDIGVVDVTSTPAGAPIFLDGEYVGVTPLELGDLPLGSYEIRVEAEGFQPQTREVHADITETSVELALVPVVVDENPRRRSSDRAVTEPRSPKLTKVLPWVVAGVGAGTVIAGAAIGASVRSTQNEFDDLLDQAEFDRDRAESLQKSGESKALTSNVLLAVGSAAVVGGVSWFIVQRTARSSNETAIILPTGNGLVVNW